MIDSHCHLDNEQIYSDLDEILKSQKRPVLENF